MQIPTLRGVIDRRILVNYRVDLDVLSKLLPEPFRPKLVHGVGIVGVCLIRLKHIRPRFVPALFGISSENAAHRIAVTWKQDGKLQEGVYIPRRDTSSWLNTLVGGRLFPGVHYHARFKVCEQDNDYHVVLDSDDGQTHLAVEGHVDSQWPAASSFSSLREASDFFEHGSLGYSSTSRQGHLDGLELRTLQWRVQPLAVRRVESSFFEDRKLFPADSVEFDCALLMRGIDHEWHGRPSLNGSTA